MTWHNQNTPLTLEQWKKAETEKKKILGSIDSMIDIRAVKQAAISQLEQSPLWKEHLKVHPNARIVDDGGKSNKLDAVLIDEKQKTEMKQENKEHKITLADEDAKEEGPGETVKYTQGNPSDGKSAEYGSGKGGNFLAISCNCGYELLFDQQKGTFSPGSMLKDTSTSLYGNTAAQKPSSGSNYEKGNSQESGSATYSKAGSDAGSGGATYKRK